MRRIHIVGVGTLMVCTPSNTGVGFGHCQDVRGLL
jgi:hypothetical protein